MLCVAVLASESDACSHVDESYVPCLVYHPVGVVKVSVHHKEFGVKVVNDLSHFEHLSESQVHVLLQSLSFALLIDMVHDVFALYKCHNDNSLLAFVNINRAV